jgi:hypothetical protein
MLRPLKHGQLAAERRDLLLERRPINCNLHRYK